MIWTVIFGIAFAFFKIQNAVDEGRHPLRRRRTSSPGLDLPEMGVLAYPEFAPRSEAIARPTPA